MDRESNDKNEQRRLEALKAYRVLDSLPERDFDDITTLASYICETPIALISLVDENRQWFKSKRGLNTNETPLGLAFCSHTILTDETMIVPDPLEDARFKDNPLVTGETNIRFYAGAPLITPSGHRIGSLCVIDHKPRELRAEQVRALEALARQVISQLELRMRAAELVIAHDTKGRFLATMSHEIRTPLGGMIGLAETMLESETSDENRKHLLTMTSCGEALLHLINDILDFSKLESDKVIIEEKKFDLRRAVAEIADLFTVQMRRKGLAFSVTVADDCPSQITGDVNRLRQILNNLLSNAIKFTETGTIGLTVRISEHEKMNTRHQIEFAVKDSGIGIDAAVQGRLFQPFTQADASTTRRFGGTGLGLAICKSLCEAMNGTISLTSRPGQGSMFTFSIQVGATTAAEETTALTESKSIPENSRALRVILAEDTPVNQTVGLAMLKRLGHEAVLAVNGDAVLRLLEEQEYDVILMDRHMPVLDGINTTKEILRRHPHGRVPYIIALTAGVLKEDEAICLGAGMHGFLTKPISVARLEAALTVVQTSKRPA